MVKTPASAMEECPRFSFCNLNYCPLSEKKYKNSNRVEIKKSAVIMCLEKG